MYLSSGRISYAFTSCASVWLPWFPSVTSGPLPDASARGTVPTRLLKSLKTRLIFTPECEASNCLLSCLSTGSRPGSWLSYDHIVSVVEAVFAANDAATPTAASTTAATASPIDKRLFTLPSLDGGVARPAPGIRDYRVIGAGI